MFFFRKKEKIKCRYASQWMLFMLLLSGSAVAIAQGRHSAVTPKPNIILILTDDQGIGDIGYLHNPFIKTPHIDSLAMHSTQLSNFYVCPVCAPTRATLMTGRYSIKTGMHDTYNGGAIMDSREVTIAEYLKEKKYTTAIFGKWHLGDNYPFRPVDQGFDESLVFDGGGLAQPGDVANFSRKDSAYFGPVLYSNNIPVKTNQYCSDGFTDGAISFIQQHKKQPFFVYLAFNAPHAPLQVPQKYYDLYRNLDKDMKQAGRELMLPEMNAQNIEAAKRVYGMVTNIDDNVGRIMASLRQEGLLDNTLVIFMSDNGPAQPRFKLGLRGQKASVYEGGIKVPCFFYYKGFKAGKIPETLAGIDVLPTLLDMLDIPAKKGEQQIDGISFLPLLEGRNPGNVMDIFKNRYLFFYWQRGYPEAYRNIAVRKGDYKLVGHTAASSPLSALEVYDIRNDSLETKNILSGHTQVAADLKNAFDKWLSNALESPHLGIQRPILGSDKQPLVILNRNDAKGFPPMWLQENIYGYWDVQVAQSGYYHIKADFLSGFKAAGTMVIRFAPHQVTVDNTDTTTHSITVDKMFIPKGDYRVECWYSKKGGAPVYPFYLVVQRDDYNDTVTKNATGNIF
ncbi:arylsulfatase [Chitinophaga sp. MM2321]|uniref:arylsulfatase n=1 Tax=Chitinophaga sp. MM2321 TaxID=3137178 RepID=UPI0032D576B5